jgi:hypothetical protein
MVVGLNSKIKMDSGNSTTKLEMQKKVRKTNTKTKKGKVK